MISYYEIVTDHYAGFLVCVVAVLAVWQFAKGLRVWGGMLLAVIRPGLIRLTFMSLWKVSVLALGLWVVRLPMADLACDLLRTNEVAIDTTSEGHAAAVYEAELKRHIDPYEFAIVQREVAALADTLGCHPAAIYEVAWSECSLNPFVVRGDGVAAGFIQFTNVGLQGFGVPLSQVKQWCKDRNTAEMMRLTRAYLLHWAKERKLHNSTDVYVAVFAPGSIHKPLETTLYDHGDAYRLNAGLDGYRELGGVVQRRNRFKDGRITINDLRLALAYKRAQLIQKYQQNDKSL